MKYADLRNQIASGDVLGWTHRPWGSWYDIKCQIVRLAQRSEYSHVGVAIVLGGRVWVLEAVTPHVRLVPLSNLLPCYHVTGNGLTDEQLELGLSWVGKEDITYSQLEAVRGFFGENNPNDGKIECAELVTTLLGLKCRATPSAVIDYKLFTGSTLREVTP